MSFLERLKSISKQIDEGMKKMEDIWSTPHIIISKYGNRDEKSEELAANQAVTLVESIREMHDEIEEGNKLRANTIRDVDKFTRECRDVYHNLEQEVAEIEALMLELGVEFPFDGKENENTSIEDPKETNNDEKKIVEGKDKNLLEQ